VEEGHVVICVFLRNSSICWSFRSSSWQSCI